MSKKRKVPSAQRSPSKDFAPNSWEPVTGRLEKEENPDDGVLREIEEETSINAQVTMPIDAWFFYRGSRKHPMILIVFWCRHVKGEVKLSWEHTNCKWITLNEAASKSALEPFRRSLYSKKTETSST